MGGDGGLSPDVVSSKKRRSRPASWAGASRRTLTRGFRRETGLSFGDWRARARVIRALALAADGRPAGHVAAAVGYRSRHALRATVGRVLGADGPRPHNPG